MMNRLVIKMEYPESKWEIQEYSYSEEGDDQTSMLKWILNKGYGIGKKMIIAGVAISPAPILLPPLVVFSAMGVAFSVPFGLFFASYACTNKIMSMLLPIPPSPLLLEYYTNEYEQDKHEGAECRFELDVGAGDDDDDGQEVEDLVTNVDGDVDEEGYDANEEEDNEQMEGLNQGGVDIVFELDEGGDGYGKDVEYEKEMEDHVVQRENVIIEEEQKEHMEDIKQEVEMRLGLDAAGEEQGYEEDVGEYLVGDDDSFETNRKFCDPTMQDVLDNEKIWEKIGAMRTIVGYKAATQPTCIGELKALYVFTGVEPPASFKDDSDLDEVNAKLKFLMSIVGVK